MTNEPGLIPLEVIASSVRPAGDGISWAETISAGVAVALADDPVAFADVLSELSYKLYGRELAERLRFRERLKAAMNNRGFEVLEFLYDPESKGKDSLYDLLEDLGAHSISDLARWAKIGKAAEAGQ